MPNILLPVQILASLFLLFAFSRVVLRYRDSTISLGMFLFWTGIWLLASLGVIRPDFTTFIADQIGIGRGADAAVYISLIILFYLLFRLSVTIENLRHDITKVVREIALKDQSKSKK